MRRILDAARGRVSRALGGGGWVLLLALTLWLVLAWPLATGQRTFILRDVMTTHLPWKAFGAAELAHGRIPAINPLWATGQPFRGNPNALPFYPGNLLYLALPFWSAFGLHYVGHWLLAFLGMRRLARELGQSKQAALVAALAYAGSGYLLTTLTFMNLLTVAAWAPWALAGLARGGRRGTLLAGVACGLMLLGGEPISAALVIPAMAIAAIGRHGWRLGLVSAAGAGVVGLLVALPQLVATARVLPYSYRFAHGLSATQAAAADLHPARLLELVWPLPWGWPSEYGRFGFWAPSITDGTPYIYSLHLGLIAFGLAFAGWRAGRAWAVLAIAALGGAWGLGISPELTSRLTGGLFRYPQKLLLLFTIAGALVAGFGVERAVQRWRPARPWLLLAALGAGAAVAIFLGRAPLLEWSRRHLAPGQSDLVLGSQLGHWTLLALVSALLALGAAWAAHRRSASGLALLQLVALLQMAPIWVTDDRANYSEIPSLARTITEPRRIAHAISAFPSWEPSALYRFERFDPPARMRVVRDDLWPDFGAFDELEHVVAADLDGLTSPLTVFVHGQLARADWPTRVEISRRLGAGWIVRSSQAAGPDFEPVAVEARAGARTELYRIPRPLPLVSWPRRALAASSPISAWVALSRRTVDEATAVVSRPVEHHAEGTATMLDERADRIVVEVDSPGGLLVIRRAYWPIWRARLADGTPLATQPVDLALLGVEVPPGHQRVIVDVTAWPETSAGIVALVTLVAAGWLAWRRP